MLVKFLKKLLFGGSFSLRDYEKKALRCFMETLGRKEKVTLGNQIENVELIQRYMGDRKVNIYLKKETERFINTGHELKVATVDMFHDNKKENVCSLVFHEGLLNSIEFSKKLGKNSSGFLYKINTVWAELSELSEEDSSNKLFVGYLQKLNGKGEVRNLKPPVEDNTREAFLKDVGNSADLHLFLEITDGFELDKLVFKGTQSLENIIEDQSFVVVALYEKGLIFLDNCDDTVKFSFYDPVNEEILWSKPTLLEAYQCLI